MPEPGKTGGGDAVPLPGEAALPRRKAPHRDAPAVTGSRRGQAIQPKNVQAAQNNLALQGPPGMLYYPATAINSVEARYLRVAAVQGRARPLPRGKGAPPKIGIRRSGLGMRR